MIWKNQSAHSAKLVKSFLGSFTSRLVFQLYNICEFGGKVNINIQQKQWSSDLGKPLKGNLNVPLQKHSSVNEKHEK
jgi:hypothetical protein